ncbi:MAG: tyrosine--tRNA ligase [Candidatus Gracilibacteria bacterium]|jgi:tyrosyl-tRNA synthetase|nr:tyrosine--tRNA ligase [Candidatus Gracilibacteria bacterium]
MSNEIKNLLEKGVVEIFVKEDLEKKLQSGKPLKIKFGIDPTGSDLHLGHMVPIRKLAQFQKMGHEIQLLFGTFTAQIGDPTGKSEARQIKTREEVQKNAETYVNQVSKVLDTKKIKLYYNDEWLSGMSLKEVCELAASFTVQQMIQRDMFQERIKAGTPIHLHEFLYPLMQGYDSVIMKSDVEIGATEQTFNMLAGRTIQKHFGLPQQNVLSVPILVGLDGKMKMGKSLNNYIGVNESPKDMFGKTMSIPDELITTYFELATDLSMEDINQVKTALEGGENPRNLKMQLAKEIVSIYHSKEEAQKAQEEFINIFAKKEIPEDIEEILLPESAYKIVQLIALCGFSGSNGEIKRLVLQNAVKVNNEKISNPDDTVDISEEIILQVGKRSFYKVKKA